MHSNTSEFYITLKKLNGFDGKYTAFGRIILGFKHFRRINKAIKEE